MSETFKPTAPDVNEPAESTDLKELLRNETDPAKKKMLEDVIAERRANIEARRKEAQARELADAVLDALGAEKMVRKETESGGEPPHDNPDSYARAFQIKGTDPKTGLPILQEVGMGAKEAAGRQEGSKLARDLEDRGMKIVGGEDTPEGVKTQFDKSAEQANQEKHGAPFIARQDTDVRITPEGIQKQALGSIRMEGDEARERMRR